MLHIVQIVLSVLILLFVAILIFGLFTSFAVALFAGSPFVPTPIKAVKDILKKAEIKKGDVLYDIGAGDGRFLNYAEKLYKAKAIGFEIDPFVFLLAKFRKIFFGWKGKIIRGNFTNYSIKDADVVICYMMPESLKKYQKKFDEELKKGCKVISYSFHIGSWKPYKIIPLNKNTKTKKIFIYKVRDNSAKIRTRKKTTSKIT